MGGRRTARSTCRSAPLPSLHCFFPSPLSSSDLEIPAHGGWHLSPLSLPRPSFPSSTHAHGCSGPRGGRLLCRGAAQRQARTLESSACCQSRLERPPPPLLSNRDLGPHQQSPRFQGRQPSPEIEDTSRRACSWLPTSQKCVGAGVFGQRCRRPHGLVGDSTVTSISARIVASAPPVFFDSDFLLLLLQKTAKTCLRFQ